MHRLKLLLMAHMQEDSGLADADDMLGVTRRFTPGRKFLSRMVAPDRRPTVEASAGYSVEGAEQLFTSTLVCN